MEESGHRNLLSPPLSKPLLFLRSKDGLKIAFSSIHPKNHSNINIKYTPSKLRGKEIQAYSNGWFILLEKEIRPSFLWKLLFSKKEETQEKKYSLWNPSTSQFICLPPLILKREQKINGCILSSAPGNPDCMLVLFETEVPSIVKISVGSDQWTHHTIKEEEIDFLSNFVMCNGTMYCHSVTNSKLVKIDMNMSDLELSVFPELTFPEKLSRISFNYMVESCGELFSVYLVKEELFNQVISMEVFRLDFSSMAWTRVESIGERAFFLSNESSFSNMANEPEIRSNHIYFTLDEDESFYSYNMEDKTVSAFLPRPKTNLWRPQIWIMQDSRFGNMQKQFEGVEKKPIPRLMVSEKGNSNCNFINLLGEKYIHIPNIQNFEDAASMSCSREGWCLMSQGKRSVFLWNPFMNKVIHLPDSPHENKLYFSFSSSTDQVVLMGVNHEYAFVDYIFLEEGAWHTRKYSIESFSEIKQCNTLTFRNGVFYGLDRHGQLFSFDESAGLKFLRRPFAPCNSSHQTQRFLVECDEALFLVCVDFMGKKILIMELYDYCKHREAFWVEVENLSNVTLYLSRYSSFATLAPEGMANRVYFSRFYSKSVVYYSLKSKKLHSHCSGEVLESFYNTKEQLYCGWIQSKWE